MGFRKKLMGKEVGQAATYNKAQDPNTLTASQVCPRTAAMRVSLGDPNADNIKTSGIEIRGSGAATKGRMARGPMA